jgi:hypothetical protein
MPEILYFVNIAILIAVAFLLVSLFYKTGARLFEDLPAIKKVGVASLSGKLSKVGRMVVIKEMKRTSPQLFIVFYLSILVQLAPTLLQT